MLQKFSNGFLREQSSKAHPMAIGYSETAIQPVDPEKSTFFGCSPIENTVIEPCYASSEHGAG